MHSHAHSVLTVVARWRGEFELRESSGKQTRINLQRQRWANLNFRKSRVPWIQQEIPFHWDYDRRNGDNHMLGLAHPVRSDFLSGLRPRNFLPVTRKIRLLDFKMRQCVGYLRP